MHYLCADCAAKGTKRRICSRIFAILSLSGINAPDVASRLTSTRETRRLQIGSRSMMRAVAVRQAKGVVQPVKVRSGKGIAPAR